ncbi:MAG: NAD(P)H-dependent oxidoreductase [Hyphomonadaceae bacterium]|nr:NAD(P)H-dependent oxidoreductase [Hyphomonadaceae bacterium]
MKHAVIVGHPDPASFTKALAKTYADCLSACGHTIIERDLYRLDFDPRLKLSEMPDRPDWAPAADVEAERRLLSDADVFAFVYPLWFNSPPAIVKGYIERVFGAGFGYGRLTAGGQEPLLTNRHFIHITASGSSSAWLNELGATGSARTLFEDTFARACGMRARPHIHFDNIVPGLEPRWVAQNLKTLETQLLKYFGPGCTNLT